MRTSQMIKRVLVALFCFLGLSAAEIQAQALGIGLDGRNLIPSQEQALPIPEQIDPGAELNPVTGTQVNRVDYRTGRYGLPQEYNALDEALLLPFGSQLFNGGFRGTKAFGVNPSYRITPGDIVTLRIWGAVDVSRDLPVDAQGNIFIPSVGPVQVKGIPHSDLNAKVRSAVQTVYPKQVEVYTNLQGVQPVAVFVTGNVPNPGRYAGTPSDSILYFLDQAGGIDPFLGSYRKVKVLRRGKVIAQADLYDFLQAGELPRVQYRDGDTILVQARGPSIAVTGDIDRPFAYELIPNELKGAALLKLARLRPEVSHVLLRGTRAQGPYSNYFSLAQFASVELSNGDEVLFSADQREDFVVVQLEGSFFGPSRYAVPKDTRLLELLNTVPVPQPLTDVKNVSMRRLSVAERQKQSLEESLQRLESIYLTATSSTPEEAQIRVREAELIQRFVERAREAEPEGRLVVADHEGEVSNLRLRDGDIITIPEFSDSILVSGEVLVPRTIVFAPGLSYSDYIGRAGGYSEQADEDRTLVLRVNGEVRFAEDTNLSAGDEILVLPKVPTKNLQIASAVSEILYQLAIATRVALNL